MGFSDLHIHTIHSFDGTSSVSAVLKHLADHTDLDVIAITDHNSMCGIPEALDLAPRYGIEVIPGCEISTADGHLLALFIEKPIDAGLPLVETVQRIGDQGGICIAAHPVARGAHSLQFLDIQRALRIPNIANILVGVEAFNSSLIFTKRNPFVEAFSKTLPLAQTGNSDSHLLKTIGHGSSEFPGHTAADLRTALENHQTLVRKLVRNRGIEVLLDYLPQYLMKKMGWVAYNANPDSNICYARLELALARQQI